MNLTAQQTAFIDTVITRNTNTALRARAGTGKTSTILAAVDALVRKDPTLEIMVCAFNKEVKLEIADKLVKRGHNDWRRVQASTVHSMGNSVIIGAYGKVEFNEHKVRDIVRAEQTWKPEELRTLRTYGSQIMQLVAYAKQAGVGFFADAPIADVNTWHGLADHFDINGLEDTSDMEEIVAVAQEVYKRSLADTASIDYNDQILFPLIKNLRVRWTKDDIFADEAQDLSRARQALIKKFMRQVTGRLHIVGDDRQAIYGFSGADANALENLIASLNAVVLPLTATFRCDRKIVELAKTLVSDIEASENAGEGVIERISALPADLRAGDAILCRTNAPLLETAYSLIRKGIACKVEGRDIGKGLVALVRRWKISSIDQLLIRLDDYREREVQKALARDNEAKAQEVSDKVETLVVICNACIQKNKRGVEDVVAAVDTMFGQNIDSNHFIVLSSMHKSKGREWDRVIILEKPIKRNMQAWQMVQESNLKYVAITRAKHTLMFMDISKPQPEKQWN